MTKRNVTTGVEPIGRQHGRGSVLDRFRVYRQSGSAGAVACGLVGTLGEFFFFFLEPWYNPIRKNLEQQPSLSVVCFDSLFLLLESKVGKRRLFSFLFLPP